MENMAQITEVLEFLKTLMHSTDHDTVKSSKNTLCDIKTYLQYTQVKVEFLELESQLQQEELKQRSHHSELVSVQNNETDSHKQQDNIVSVQNLFQSIEQSCSLVFSIISPCI